MNITDKLEEIFILTVPELYGDFAVKERDTVVIYVEQLKSLYGLLLAAVLFYKKLLKYLKDKWFVLKAKIVYCPTGEMIADYFTKPLQGSIFKKFREEILNLKEE